MSPWNLTSGKAAVILMFQHCLFQHMAETISHIMQYTIMYSIANICWQRDLKASKGQNSCLICKHFVGKHKVFLAQELLIFNWCMQCKIFLSWSPFLLFVEGSNLATYNNLHRHVTRHGMAPTQSLHWWGNTCADPHLHLSVCVTGGGVGSLSVTWRWQTHLRDAAVAQL